MKKYIVILIILSITIFGFIYLKNLERPLYVDIQYVHLDSIHKVIEIKDSLVTPVLYDSLIIPKFISAEIRKNLFINQILPAILIVRYQIEQNNKCVTDALKCKELGKPISMKDSLYIDSLLSLYDANSYNNLLIRMKLHPISLVLAQAALESGWGTSRFAIEGNNLFGMKSLPNDSKRIRSIQKNGGRIFIKKYDNVAESINHYFLTLGRNDAYYTFRNKRYEEADVFKLIKTLNKYSEKGSEYGIMLKNMVEWNDLKKFENYSIDPKFIKKVSFSITFKKEILNQFIKLKRLYE